MKMIFLFLAFVVTLQAMDNPRKDSSAPEPSNEHSLYFGLLNTDVCARLLPTYMAGARTQVRDNRGDEVAEQINSALTYKQLLKKQYAVDISNRDSEFIEQMVMQLSSNPPSKKAACLPNRVCLTAFFNPQLLRDAFNNEPTKEKVLSEFRTLPQDQKNNSVLQVMRFCPSAQVIEGLLQAGANHNARDEKSGFCLLRLALESRISGEERKSLLNVFKGIATLDPDCGDRKGITPLMRAVSLKDAHAVDTILPHAAVNLTDHAYNTALGIAARVGDGASVTKILAKHPNLYLCNPYHQSNNVFAQAAQCPNESDALVILKALVLARNTMDNITRVQEFQYFLDLALIESARLGRIQCVDFLMHLPNITFEGLEKKPPFFNPDIPRADTDDSALTSSLRHGFYDITLELLTNAPDIPKHSISLSAQMREKALALAVKLRCKCNESTETEICNKLDVIIDRMLKTKVIPKADTICLPACYKAACANHATLLKKLIDYGKKKNPEIADKVLFHAAQKAHAQATSAILEYTNADMADMNGDTVLHKAIVVDKERAIDCIAVLLNHDANLFKANKWGQTVFHKVVTNNDAQVRATLLQMFADQIRSETLLKDMVNKSRNDTSETPLHVACALPNRTDTVQQLIKMGADIHKTNIKGETPLLIAAAHFNVELVAMLLEAGADPNTKNHSGCGPLTKAAGACVQKEKEIERAKEIVRLLRIHGANLEEFIDSMLRNAARHGNTVLVNDLLRLGADPHQGSSSFKNTALHQAAKKGHEDTVEALISYSDVNAPNSGGYTAMELSCINDTPYEVTEKFLFHQQP